MTFEQMKVFLEAAHYGSFTYAAEQLGLTQSAVSVCIKKLEEKHDVELFDRSGRRLMLTEAGQVLLGEAERILRDVELTVQRIESRRPDDKSSIVACTGNSYDCWMAEIAFRTKSDLPKIELIRGSIEEVAAWVMRGTADVGITSRIPTHSQFRQIRVFEDRLILCGSTIFPRNIPDDINWGDLAEYSPFIWEQSDLTPSIMAGFSAQRLDPNRLSVPKLKLSSSTAVLSALMSGCYLGFVPKRAADAFLQAGLLKRIGRLEIPVPYWMFALRERDIDSFAARTAQLAVPPAILPDQLP